MYTRIALLIAAAGLLRAQSPAEKAPLPAAWRSVAVLNAGDVIRVIHIDGQPVEGRFQGVTADGLVLEGKGHIHSLLLPSVRRVFVRRKGSRAKAAAIGAAVGFGIGFPIGAASAGTLADQNSPSAATRAGFGAGLGLFIGGVGAGLGALAGGSRYETVYREK